MKYMITNGNSYVHVIAQKSGEYVEVNNGFEYATLLKHSEAQSFMDKSKLSMQKGKWSIQRIRKVSSKKNYIISTGCKYIGTGGEYTSEFHAAKWFKSVADADTYRRTHMVFDNAIIVDEKGNVADVGDKKTFTPEQLQTLGLVKSNNIPLENRPDASIIKRAGITCGMKKAVYQKSNGRCGICGKPIKYNNFTVDHIVPLARGGKNDLSNYQAACQECNTIKGSLKNEEFVKSITTILSNQLQQNPDRKLEDMLVRSIVRNRIGTIKDRVAQLSAKEM